MMQYNVIDRFSVVESNPRVGFLSNRIEETASMDANDFYFRVILLQCWHTSVPFPKQNQKKTRIRLSSGWFSDECSRFIITVFSAVQRLSHRELNQREFYRELYDVVCVCVCDVNTTIDVVVVFFLTFWGFQGH